MENHVSAAQRVCRQRGALNAAHAFVGFAAYKYRREYGFPAQQNAFEIISTAFDVLPGPLDVSSTPAPHYSYNHTVVRCKEFCPVAPSFVHVPSPVQDDSYVGVSVAAIGAGRIRERLNLATTTAGAP